MVLVPTKHRTTHLLSVSNSLILALASSRSPESASTFSSPASPWRTVSILFSCCSRINRSLKCETVHAKCTLLPGSKQNPKRLLDKTSSRALAALARSAPHGVFQSNSPTSSAVLELSPQDEKLIVSCSGIRTAVESRKFTLFTTCVPIA